MTYPASKQGTFAVIILISFCLTLLAFVQTTQHAQNTHKKQVAQFVANQLADNGKNALALDERVSLSVLSNRYLIDDAIGFIGFYDTKQNPLVEVGSQDTGEAVWLDVHDNANLVGQVKVAPTPTGSAKIIAGHWLFLLANLLIHTLLWLIYGFVARPNKTLVAQIEDDVKNRLHIKDAFDATLKANSQNTAKNTTIKNTIAKNVDEFLKSAKNKTTTDKTSKTASTDTWQTNTQDANTQDNNHKTSQTAQDTANANHDKPSNINCVVHIVFEDKENLLEMLSDDRLAPYLQLCDELLQKTVNKMLKLPNLGKVRLIDIENFEKTGACVKFANGQGDDRNVLAGAMLAKLMPMINKVIYEKHRDIHKFALPMRVIASTSDKAMHAKNLLKRYPNASMILMNPPSAKIVAGVMNIVAPKNPTSIHEKECRFLEEVSDTVANQLQRVRHQVLTEDID